MQSFDHSENQFYHDAEPSEGVFYKCLRGDSENLAVAEPDSFVVHDAKGRDWFCYPVSEEDAATLHLPAYIADVMAADAALRKHGLSDQGTEVRVYFCQEVSELTEKLAMDLPRKA
jgi:hypothetical protein